MAAYHTFSKSYSILENIKKHTLTPYSENILYPDTFTFSSATGILHFNSTDKKSANIYEVITDLEVGDIVEVTVDFRSLSGTLPKIAFDEFGNTDYFNAEYKQIKRLGEWETLSAKYVFRDFSDRKKLRYTIGLWTADVGEFQMRNLRATIQTKRNVVDENKQISASFELKPFEIRKDSGVWDVRTDFAYAESTLVVISDTTLQLNFAKPFQTRPVSALSGDFFVNSYKVNPKIGQANKDYLQIQFYDSVDGTLKNLSDVPNYTHFGLIVVG